MATFMTELDDAGEVRFLMEAETTGAFAKSDMEIELTGWHQLNAADFIL